MRYLLILFVILCTVLTTGCSSTISNLKPFKLEIQQGNVVTSKMLLQLRPGMTKSQVRYIMGTPLIVDSFHGNRWDYVFQLRQSGKITEQKRVVLKFENELLKSVRGDVVPADAGGSAVKLTPAAEKTAPKTRDAKDYAGESFIDKLKFWKDKPSTDADKKIEAAPMVAEPPSNAVPDGVSPAAAIVIDKGADGSAKDATSQPSEPVSMEPIDSDKAPLQEPLLTAPSIGPAAEPTFDPAPEVKAPVKPVQQTITPKPVVVPTAKPKVAPASLEPAPMPVEPTPMTKADDAPMSGHELKLDRTLDSNKPTKEAPTTSPANSNQSEEPDEAPGYFERILEKIGF